MRAQLIVLNNALTDLARLYHFAVPNRDCDVVDDRAIAMEFVRWVAGPRVEYQISRKRDVDFRQCTSIH